MPRPNGYLFDTCVMIAIHRFNELGHRIVRDFGLVSGDHASYLPHVVVAESKALAAKWGWGTEKRDTLADLLSAYEVLHTGFDDVTDSYVEIDAQMAKAGTRMGKNDLWIAALARTHDLTLLTTDTDFRTVIDAQLIDGVLIASDKKSRDSDA